MHGGCREGAEREQRGCRESQEGGWEGAGSRRREAREDAEGCGGGVGVQQGECNRLQGECEIYLALQNNTLLLVFEG